MQVEPMEIDSEEHVILHSKFYNDLLNELFVFTCSEEKDLRQVSPVMNML